MCGVRWLSLVLQSVKFGLPLTDVAKLINAMILEYTTFPITREDAAGLPAEELAAQLRCAKARKAVEDLQTYLREPTSCLEAVTRAFGEGPANVFRSVSARLTEDAAQREATLTDGMKIAGILVASLASFKVPAKAEVSPSHCKRLPLYLLILHLAPTDGIGVTDTTNAPYG